MISILRKNKSYLYTFLLVLGMCFSVSLIAAVPEKSIGFQGQLYAYNAPVTNTVNATFTFYDALTDGTVTGSTISKVITVSNGYFGTTFSEADTTGVDFNQQLYLEVTINGTPLTPRTSVNPTVSSLKTFGAFSYATPPTVGPVGSLYFNSTTNELYVSQGSSWQLAGISSSTTQWTPNGTTLTYMNGNVGIGTTTSPDLLHVSKDQAEGTKLRVSNYSPEIGAFAQMSVEAASATGSPVRFYNYAFGTGYATSGRFIPESVLIDTNAVNGLGISAGQIRFYTSGSNERMRINAAGLVGIGTTTPTALLHINPLTSQAGFRLETTASELYPQIVSRDVDGLTLTTTLGTKGGILGTIRGHGFIGTESSHYFIIRTNNQARVTVSPDGAVAIGTNGTDLTGGATQKLTVIASSTSDSQILLRSSRAALVLGNVIGGIDFGSNDTSLGTNGSTTASIQALANQTHTASALGTDLVFKTTTGVIPNEAMRILGNGNVGIGATTSTYLLHVGPTLTNVTSFTGTTLPYGNILNPQIVAVASSGEASIGITVNDGTNNRRAKLFVDNTNSTWGLMSTYATGGRQPFVISQANTEVFRIDALGNIGIGTSTPGYKLAFGTAGDSIGIDLTSSGITRTSIVELYSAATGAMSLKTVNNSTGGIEFWTQSSQRMTVARDGNVGIGTTTPARALHIAKDGVGPTNSTLGGAQIMITGSTNPTRRLGIGYDTTSNFGWIQAAEPGVAATTALILNGIGGNVGIGTTTPTEKLHVDGRILSAGSLAGLVLSPRDASGNNWTVYNNTGLLRFNNGTDKVSIDSAGNVGIGTLNPLYPLSVTSGDVGFSKVIHLGGNSETAFNATDTHPVMYSTAATGSVYPFLTAGNLVFQSRAAGGIRDIAFVNGTTPAVQMMVQGSTGNVGIGTTSPTSRLHILSGDNTSTTNIAAFYANNETQGVGISYQGIQKLAAAANNPLYIDAKGTGALILQSLASGNVGIGTSTPGSKLHVVTNGGFTPSAQTVASFQRNGSSASDAIISIIAGNAATSFLSFGDTDSESIGRIEYSHVNNSLAFRTNGVGDRLVISSSGNVGIGTTTPTQALVASGTIQSTDLLGGITTLSVDASGNIIRTPSDSKLKTNVETITSALEKVNAMRGVSYNWLDTSRFGPDKEIGFIAQELETIVPEVVKSGGEYKSVNYQNLVALLVEAIKELNGKVNGFAENFKSKKVDTDQLCIGSTCVNESQLKQLLQNQNIQSAPAQAPTPTPDVVEVEETEEVVTPPAPEVLEPVVTEELNPSPQNQEL